MKNNIRSISESIERKRNSDLDSDSFPISQLTLSEYDIRKTRNVEKLAEALKTLGQQEPMTITKNGDKYTIVNGKTRKLAMEQIGISHAKIRGYSDLTQMEQDFLNAQLNVTQNPLTPDEKIAFVIKYKDELDVKDLAKALDLGEEMMKNYIAVSEVVKDSPKVKEAWTPEKGHNRGDVKVEELGKTVRKLQQMDVEPTPERLEILGTRSNKSTLKRDEKRKVNVKVVEKFAELALKKEKRKERNEELIKEKEAQLAQLAKEKEEQQAEHALLSEKEAQREKMKQEMLVKQVEKKFEIPKESLLDKVSEEELLVQVEKEAGITNNSKNLPINSQKKYKFIDEALSQDEFKFALILYAEGIHTFNQDGFEVDTETKRIIDEVDDVSVVGNEILKLTEIEDYGNSLNKKLTIYNRDVLDVCDELHSDDRRGFIYVNGASSYSQRPEFMEFLKRKYPNSEILMVFVDLIIGKSQVNGSERLKERTTVYAGATNMNEIMIEFQRRVPSTFLKYADSPQEKFIVVKK